MGTGLRGVGLAAAMLVAAGLLGGCSGRPSTEDAQAAFVAEFDRAFDGGARVEEVRRFELSGCEPAQEVDGYLCDVEGELVLNIAGTQVPRPLKGRFRFTGSNGWDQTRALQRETAVAEGVSAAGAESDGRTT